MRRFAKERGEPGFDACRAGTPASRPATDGLRGRLRGAVVWQSHIHRQQRPAPVSLGCAVRACGGIRRGEGTNANRDCRLGMGGGLWLRWAGTGAIARAAGCYVLANDLRVVLRARETVV